VSKSVDSEDDLWERARRTFDAGDLENARYLFQQVVALNGNRRYEAEQYLIEIERRQTQVSLREIGAPASPSRGG